MGEREAGELRYTAFLSYSHKDAAAAQRLHRRLETYRLPRRLVGSMAAWGPVPSRLWPIFRDREELPAATDLSETVRQALAQSGSLIVLCSPHSVASLWVAEEIATFRRLHPDRPILAAILDGDPPDCFPELLRVVDADGKAHEPLATDLRREGDGSRLGLLKLVAGITGIGLDELVQRDASRRVRRVTAVTAGAVVAMLIMAALTMFALNARSEAERQRAEAEGLIEFMLTDLRARLRGVGRLDVLTAVNQRALEYYGGQDELEDLGPASLERRARILLAMGADDLDRGNYRAALEAFREAHRATEEHLTRDPQDPDRVFTHAQSEYWIGRVDELRGNYRAALTSYQQYRAHAERLAQLDPDNVRSLGELAYAESNLGIVNHSGFGRSTVARRHFQRSLHWFTRAGHAAPNDREWISEAADARAWIADTFFSEGRFLEARRQRIQEQRLKTWLLEQEPSNRAYLYATVITARSLARIDMELGMLAQAVSTLRDSATTMNTLLETDPTNVVWRDQAARIRADLAQILLAMRRRNEAGEVLQEGAELISGTDARNAAQSTDREHLRRRIATLMGELSPE